MKFLPRPASAKGDLEVITAACKKYSWSKYEKSWRKAYLRYFYFNGNPWALAPATPLEPVSKQQYELYDSRKSGGPIRRIRNTKHLLSCPVCGSGTTGHVDHYLPRTEFPEFSIMRANLVPACPHCNSSVKGSHVKGTNPERFIHPYFDTWADKPLWHIKFVRPLEAVQFRPVPGGNLTEQKKKIVRYHLTHVLGDQFHLSMERKWSTLPALLNLRIKSSKQSPKSTRKAIKKELEGAEVTTGKNSWETAFYRGLLIDKQAVDLLHKTRLKTL